MGDAPTKTEFLEHIRKSRAELDALVKRIDRSLMTQPGVSGNWSVKDVLAHITWHEREMFNVVHQRALAGSDLWNQPTEKRNEAIYNENKDRALKDVLDDYAIVFEGMMELMETLSDEDLRDASHFSQMPSDWIPWEIIAQNTYEHYDDHLADLAAGLAKSKQS